MIADLWERETVEYMRAHQHEIDDRLQPIVNETANDSMVQFWISMLRNRVQTEIRLAYARGFLAGEQRVHQILRGG